MTVKYDKTPVKKLNRESYNDLTGNATETSNIVSFKCGKQTCIRQYRASLLLTPL